MNAFDPDRRRHAKFLVKASRRESRAARRRGFWERFAAGDVFDRASLRAARRTPLPIVAR
jgi:hypothetical protein